MAETAPQRSFPLGPLLGAAAVLALAVAAAGTGRVIGAGPMLPPASVLAARAIRFADLPDGGIAVSDARDGHRVGYVAAEADGFLRASVRGLVQARKQAGQGPAVPFELTQWSDGRLTLDDPTTRRRIDLEAFGPTNAARFARLLAGAP